MLALENMMKMAFIMRNNYMRITVGSRAVNVKITSKKNAFNKKLTYKSIDKVNDEVRGILYFDLKNNNWVFCGMFQKKISAICNINKIENLVLLLESPHKDEYDIYGNPLRPANGRTGTNINNLFAKQINNNNLKINTFQNNIAYRVWIVNAIQYQTSGYNQLHNIRMYNQSWRIVRNNVFKALWNNEKKFNLQADLVRRLNQIAPSIIINCVTGGKNKNGLKMLVENVLYNHNLKSSALYYHPSCWK